MDRAKAPVSEVRGRPRIAFLGGMAIFGISNMDLGPAILAIAIAFVEVWKKSAQTRGQSDNSGFHFGNSQTAPVLLTPLARTSSMPDRRWTIVFSWGIIAPRHIPIWPETHDECPNQSSVAHWARFTESWRIRVCRGLRRSRFVDFRDSR